MYPAKSPILSGFFAAQTPFFKVSNSYMMGKVDHAIITSLGIKVMEGLLK